MNIHEFVSQYTNYPILFIGTGISLRYLKDSYTWDSLLSKIASELYGNDEKYLDVKARCKDEHGNFQFNQVATIIEEDFNSFLMLPENRTGKFKKINDFYYEQMREHQRDISRFKIYLSQLLSPLKFKEEKENELLEKFQELEEYKYHLNKMQAGTVLFSDDKKGLFIKANDGILQVLEIQGENSKRMVVGDFLRGNPVEAGKIFE